MLQSRVSAWRLYHHTLSICRLEEIDAKLRDMLSRKESSPSVTPNNLDHTATPTSTPGISPVLHSKRNSEKVKHTRNRSDTPHTPKQWMSQSTDWEHMSLLKSLGHRRQFSDSMMIVSMCLEEQTEQELTDHGSLKKTYSDSELDVLPTAASKPEIRHINFQEKSPVDSDLSPDRQRSQTVPTGVTITVTDIETLKGRDVSGSNNADRLLLAVQSEEEDFLTKLRGNFRSWCPCM